MSNINTVTIEGNVSNVKLNDKKNFVSFSLAENITYKKNDKEVKETHWYNIVAYKGTAQFIDRNIVQGDKVLVHGRLTTNNYENEDGQTIKQTQIVASDVRVTFRKFGKEQK